MTKLLEQAIEGIRKLPPGEQDAIAEFLFGFIGKPVNLAELDPETRAAVEEGLAQIKRGEFASDEEMAAFFARHR